MREHGILLVLDLALFNPGSLKPGLTWQPSWQEPEAHGSMLQTYSRRGIAAGSCTNSSQDRRFVRRAVFSLTDGRRPSQPPTARLPVLSGAG